MTTLPYLTRWMPHNNIMTLYASSERKEPILLPITLWLVGDGQQIPVQYVFALITLTQLGVYK